LTPRKPRPSSLAGLAFLLACGTAPLVAITQQTGQPIQPDSTVSANGVYKVRGDVSAPKLIHQVEPKLSRTARQSKESANAWVRLKLYVETDGSPSNISVVGVFDKKGAPITGTDSDPIYNELKEDAVEAAKQYRFEPGKKNGTPVRVELNVAVNFHS
jgi:periplasmic protein TonB